MNITAFFALARRDIRLFFLDRRAVVMSFLAPILIASFFGYIFGGAGNDGPASKIDIAVVNQDPGGASGKIIDSLRTESALNVKQLSLDEARTQVRSGKISAALVLPAGFTADAARAFVGTSNKPALDLLYDPSHATDMQLVRGVLTQHVMEVVSTQAFGSGGSGFRPKMPYTVNEEAVTAHHGTPYNSMAHSFAGMAVQFILFMGIDAGLVVLAQRQTGLWKRLQAAPISRFTVIGSRTASAAAISALILIAVFSFARLVFGVKVEGSFPGFLGVCVAFSLMTATFGLLVAVLGKTPEATRGIAILVTLMLVMLGGAWVPAFLFPQWLQNITFLVPTRWAVDGLDAMLWRGLGWNAAVGPILALLGFALLFGLFAVWRFRWETE